MFSDGRSEIAPRSTPFLRKNEAHLEEFDVIGVGGDCVGGRRLRKQDGGEDDDGGRGGHRHGGAPVEGGIH